MMVTFLNLLSDLYRTMMRHLPANKMMLMAKLTMVILGESPMHNECT